MFFLHHTVYLCVENIFLTLSVAVVNTKHRFVPFFYSGCLWPLFLCMEYIANVANFRFRLRDGWMVPRVLKESLLTHVFTACPRVPRWTDSSHPILRHISAGNVSGISWKSKSKIKTLGPTWTLLDCDSSVPHRAKNGYGRTSLCFAYLAYIHPQNKLSGVRRPSLVKNAWRWRVLSHLLYCGG